MEENANRVEVYINGKPYRMKSGNEVEYMKIIAETVDDMMSEIRKNNNKLGREDLAVLAALNLADRLRKKEDEADSLEDRLTAVQSENEGLKRNIEELTKELNDFITAFDRTKNLKL